MCPNLKVLVGGKYRITYDEGAWEPGKKGQRSDPWLMQVPCGGGVTIYPYGEGLLALELDGHPYQLKKLLSIPGVRLHQDGDYEKTLLFPVEAFEQVARVVRPHVRKRRRPVLAL